MLELARERGLAECFAHIYSFNTQSQKMFESIGFVPQDEERYIYKLQKGEPTMTKLTLEEKQELIRMALAARERAYTPYSDSGIVAIYFSCDHDNTDHCIELIEGELGRLRNTPLSARRLSMAKKQFIAQLAISMESNEGYMLGAGKSFLAHREVDTMEEVYRKIQVLTAEDLTAVASSVFSSPSRLIYK